MRRRRLENLSDEELSTALVHATGETRALYRAEAERRLLPLVQRFTQQSCKRIGHRGERDCPGLLCDLAFTSGWRVLRDKIIGTDGKDRTTATNARRSGPVLGLIERFPDRRTKQSDLFQFIASNRSGWDTEVRRAWNLDRGLLARARPNRTETGPLTDGFARWIQSSVEVQFVEETGARVTRKPMDWVDALYDDACETGTAQPVDTDRVARRLKLDTVAAPLRKTLIEQADRVVEHHAPTLFQAFENARSLTRRIESDPLPDDLGDTTGRRRFR